MAPVSGAAWMLVGVCVLPTLGWGAVFDVQLNYSEFGTVKQSDVPAADGPTGANSCAPTATANALAFLQNQSPGVYGTSLVGAGTYSDVQGTATTLASASYMNTSSSFGTSPNGLVYGEFNYLENAAPGKTSFGGMGNFGINTTVYPWFTNADPTFNFMYTALANDAAEELAMMPTAGGAGHVLTLIGLNWNDANGDGIIQQSEGATMTYVDPESGAVGTSDIWQLAAGGVLHTDYFAATDQDSYTLTLATTEEAVPEPASLGSLAAGMGLLLKRRRR